MTTDCTSTRKSPAFAGLFCGVVLFVVGTGMLKHEGSCPMTALKLTVVTRSMVGRQTQKLDKK